MKQRLVALLLVSVMVASALGAISLSATKAEAGEPTHIHLFTSNANPPTDDYTFQIYGWLGDSKHVGVAGKPIEIWGRYDDQTAGELRLTVTTDANGYFTVNARNCKTLCYRALFRGDQTYDGSRSDLVWIYYPPLTSTTLILTSATRDPNPYQTYLVYGWLYDSNGQVVVVPTSIDLWKRIDGQTTGYKLATLTTTSWGSWGGSFSTYDSDYRLVYYRAVFSGDCDYWGAKSNLISVDAR